MLPVLTDLITPFDSTGCIDYSSLDNIIRHQLNERCGIVLFGTTGECPTLTKEERIQIMKLVKENFSKDIVNFVIEVGGYNIIECMENIKKGKEFGFETFMITCPYYNKSSQEGMKAYFSFICEKFVENNFIIYNIPGRTIVNLLPQTFYQIYLANPNIIGIKESSGDINQMIMVKRLCPNILLYSGDDALLIPTLSIDGYGVISVISNLLPRQINLVIELYKISKQSKAFEEYLKYDELIRLIFVETNPTHIKFILKIRGLIETNNIRLPLVQMVSQSNEDKIIQELGKIFK